MNPSELRMMWMNQYNTGDRITLEDATTIFGHPSVGFSVMDDHMGQQTQVDHLNPMMSFVGNPGDFSNQAAAAAAAAVVLGVQPTALIPTGSNTNDIYGLAQMSGLQQQLLQQSAAAAFQNYTDMTDENNAATAGLLVGSADVASQQFALVTGGIDEEAQAMYDQIEDSYENDLSGLTSKQEIINIDDFVTMNESNSYDGTDFMSTEKDLLSHTVEGQHEGGNEDELLVPLGIAASGKCTQKRIAAEPTPGGASTSHHVHPRVAAAAARKTRKIEPVNRPGLVLKTPIAYKGNIDPSVIPIQKDGMAVCERCGAIGVKHTFYTKSRRFCSMSCARGELYSLVVTNKMSSTSSQQQQQSNSTTSNDELSNDRTNSSGSGEQQEEKATDIESALRVAHIKNTNYRFRITDQSKITQINGFGEPLLNAVANANDAQKNGEDATTTVEATTPTTTPKGLRMYQDIMPQEGMPQIPKYDSLPGSCPQLEKALSVRRRVDNGNSDLNDSYDWSSHFKLQSFRAAPVTCFPHAPGYDVWDSIDIDMKVEVENTDCDNLEIILPGQTPQSFWVAFILKTQGYKALLRYEGFESSSHDFWVNLCNAEVHSVGWCAARGKPLIPPRTIQNKYKDWKDFLVARLSGARTLPSNFYNKINESMQSRFRVGLNLECVDKNHISQVRLATVTKIVGKRLYLRYFNSDDGFWCHEDAPIIHPVGWATTVGHNLAAPQDYLERMLAGREAMIEVHEDDATIELFKMNFTFEEYYVEDKRISFMKGMKIEAVDPLNLSAICAATVMAVLKFGYMMIRIDSYTPDEKGIDWFCYHEKSPFIFPVGFCAAHNIRLTPPNGYDVDSFNWQAYLRDTGSVAADPQLFQRFIPNHGFEVGMSVECADIMDPRLVCVATVSRVVGRLLKVHFDGWQDEYDQWMDCESPDLYPVGWCALVNHKLEGPPKFKAKQAPAVKGKVPKKRKKKGGAAVTPTSSGSSKSSNNNQADSDSNVKIRTIPLKTTPHLPKLSIKLGLKPEHHNASFYEDSQIDDDDDDNDDDDEDYEDDSLSHRSDQSAHIPNVNTTSVSSSPMLRINLGKEAKSTHGGSRKSATTASPSAKTNMHSPLSSSKYIPRLIDSNTNDPNDNSSSGGGGSNPATSCATNTNSSGGLNTNQPELQPGTWNIYDVSQFLRVNDCTSHCDLFSRNKIDGKRLIELTKDEVITLLGMKVGPALKIYDLIQQLKGKMNAGGKSRHAKSQSKTASTYS